jgi:hypothetical protein
VSSEGALCVRDVALAPYSFGECLFCAAGGPGTVLVFSLSALLQMGVIGLVTLLWRGHWSSWSVVCVV